MSALRMYCLGALLLWTTVLVAGCGAGSDADAPSPAHTQAPPSPPAPPDVGDIGHFNSCKAEPRRTLSAHEQCQIEKLKARCTKADDCLVSCISSPHGYQQGGGCSHICFYGPHQGEPKPSGWDECSAK